MNESSAIQWTNLLVIPGMLLGFTVHELGHALAAYWLGDHSQVTRGKLTLNPLTHMSALGSIAFLITGYFGWPKSLQVDPNNLRHKYLSLFIVAMCGPLASLTLTLGAFLVTLITFALLIYGSGSSTNEVLTLFFPTATLSFRETFNITGLVAALTWYIFISSLSITCLSLIPLPGFDGFTAIFSLIIFAKEQWQTQFPAPAAAIPPKSPAAVNQRKRRSQVCEIHFKAGTEYHEAQQYDDAIARYRQALTNDNHFGPAYVNSGRAYLAKGKRKEAIQAFRQAIQFADDPQSVGEAWQQLRALSEISPTDEAKAHEAMQNMGAEPWTDTLPRPDWLYLTFSVAIWAIVIIVMYSYLLMQLITKLKS